MLFLIGIKESPYGVHPAVVLHEVLARILKVWIPRANVLKLRRNTDVLLRLVNSDRFIKRRAVAAREMNAVTRRPDHNIMGRKVATCERKHGQQHGEELHDMLSI